MKNPIIVALDLPTAAQAIELARLVAPAVGAFKIGSELFTAAGPDMVRQIRATGASVFLDLKFHDIPNTVAKAVASAVRLDVQMLTIHAGGGRTMMQAAEESAQRTAAQLGVAPPLVLAVTVLTSLGPDELPEIGVNGTLGSHVQRLAELACSSGIRGLVCSPLEVAGLRQSLGRDMKFVTPGIRSGSDSAGDQKRTLSAAEALEAGADWLVVGRPIYAAPSPLAAAEAILATLPNSR